MKGNSKIYPSAYQKKKQESNFVIPSVDILLSIKLSTQYF